MTRIINKLVWKYFDWVSSVLRLRQHNIGYTADDFYRSSDPALCGSHPLVTPY